MMSEGKKSNLRNTSTNSLILLLFLPFFISCESEEKEEGGQEIPGESAECIGKCDSASDKVEEQRKYLFSNFDENLEALLTQGGEVAGINIKQHSTYSYMDIYIDNREFDLYKNNLSFRIRRRTYDDGSINWGIQLKSEMLNPGDVRMEVEIDHEDVIDYKVKYKNDKIKLIDLLDEIFDSVVNKINDSDADLKLGKELDALEEWLEDKAKDSGKAPFKKLRDLKDDLDFDASLKSLRPVIIGRSTRIRSHCYVDLNDTIPELSSLEASEMNENKVPAELQADNLIWTMEASYDNAVFLPIQKGTCADMALVKEFEVENKYRPLDNGRFIMDIFENGLISQYGMVVKLDSKYRQSVEQIYPADFLGID